MVEAVSVSFAPWDITVAAEDGETVLEVANRADIDIEALCAGKGICGTCKVQVREGEDNLSEVLEVERATLDADLLEDSYRLACGAELHGPVTVYVPDASRSQGGIVMTEGREIEFELDPTVRQHHLEIQAPTLEDNTADRERIFEALAETYDITPNTTDRLTLADLPDTLREVQGADDTFRCTATLYDETELQVLRPGQDTDSYGLAVDIGTTTLAVYLVDLRSGEVASVTSRLNPQSKHGGDIISRVEHAKDDAGAMELQSEITEAINECIYEVTEEAAISTDEIFEVVFVGNTAMHHLFLGIDAKPVAATPYVPATHGDVSYKARELDIDINPAGYLYWLPIIGGWVGPDFVADLLAADILNRDETTVCIDIGTNGEIAAFNGEEAWVASAPAGPALEGAEISNGMRARPGAIQGITIEPGSLTPTLDVIGGQDPIGICGSGILDAVAELFRVGAINRRGRFQDPDDWERIRTDENGDRVYVLVYGEESGDGSDITISQADIRDIQNAKAAIQTGTRILLAEAGIEDVDRLVMAGGFGNYIDPESAKLIGMYPEIDADEVEFLGNAAGYGAMFALMNTDAKTEARRIVDEVTYVELAAWDGFHEEFMAAMYLPHRDFEQYPSVKETIESVRDIDTSLG